MHTPPATPDLSGAPGADAAPGAGNWHAQEMLLMREVMKHIGKSLAPDVVLREMLHLCSELLGLNRGRIVLADNLEALMDLPPGSSLKVASASIRYAYGLTRDERERGHFRRGEGITGRVLATGQLIIVQDIDREPTFLCRTVQRDDLPPGPVSFIAMPVRVGLSTVGVLACHRIRHRYRSLADDLTILGILATLIGQLLELRFTVEQRTRTLEAHNMALTQALEASPARYGIVGTSPVLLRSIAELEQVAATKASVLLLGESGTGKEMFARALHLASPRRDHPFIKVNCAAIPETLFESELFGYEKGAFTGAVGSRAGLFEQAHGGTIFLDEIGELPLSMQTKLLRTLQEGTIVRLGGKREVHIDARLVAATNRDLAHEVTLGAFREDLFYRLNVIPIRLPALRERSSDVHELAIHFLNRFNQANQRNVNLSPGALQRLQAHAWPGNIRELANLIERMVLLGDKSVLEAVDIERFLPRTSPADALRARFTADDRAPRPATMDVSLVRPYLPAASHALADLTEALRQQGGNRSRAAQALGLTLRQFNYRMVKLKGVGARDSVP
ncbi:sigma 54-interacting transcriptional regulator [Aquabacterium sp.]|uniref:sigma 54-interacting transcriptional regulator n=1 Tax=Aquabacterium sp. TaxID=1872578 RepID=UPI003BB0B5CD